MRHRTRTASGAPAWSAATGNVSERPALLQRDGHGRERACREPRSLRLASHGLPSSESARAHVPGLVRAVKGKLACARRGRPLTAPTSPGEWLRGEEGVPRLVEAGYDHRREHGRDENLNERDARHAPAPFDAVRVPVGPAVARTSSWRLLESKFDSSVIPCVVVQTTTPSSMSATAAATSGTLPLYHEVRNSQPLPLLALAETASIGPRTHGRCHDAHGDTRR
jgi:hypothetical protein